MNLTLIYIAGAAMLAVGIGFIATLLRRNPSHRPEGAVQWFGVVMSGLLVVFSGLLLVLTFQLDQRLEAAPAQTVSLEGTPMNEPAPDFDFQLVDTGEAVNLAAYEGKVVLLNFWATWCMPCLAEMPDLNELHAAYEDEGLVVLTVSDEPREELIDFHTDQIPLNTVSGFVDDPTLLPAPFDKMVVARPSTFVIDRDGTIRQYVVGARNYEFFEDAVAQYL